MKPQDIAKRINKELGKDTVMLGSDPSLIVTYLPTGVTPIDDLLEGGLPRGRFIEVFGDYSSLKSYIGLSAIAETQATGGSCALIDTEHSFDPDWACDIGVDTKNLLIERPASGELAVDVSEVCIRNGVDLLVWDSVAATLPKTEQQKRSVEPVQPARLAAFMSAAMRKLTPANKQTAVMFINQTRLNVGMMFGSPETTPGGRALPFYASYRLALRKGGKIKADEKTWDGQKNVTVHPVIAQKIHATLEKSKLNSPHRDAWFVFDLRTGRVDQDAWERTSGRLGGPSLVKSRASTKKSQLSRGSAQGSIPVRVQAGSKKTVVTRGRFTK